MVQKIRAFVVSNYLFGEEGKLENDDSFMETGIIDSTGILELVRFLEATFSIKVADEELIPDNLDSINKILAYLQGKLPSSAAAGNSSPVEAARS
ncbi:MAG TPA: acyl carrier protein [Nitrospiraceae bacterium]|nr:acyl carrier protein [Nitrospiraceae bacterium]